MDGIKVPNASGAVVVCGKCNVPMELHPVESCPYVYFPIKHVEDIVGYYMLKK